MNICSDNTQKSNVQFLFLILKVLSPQIAKPISLEESFKLQQEQDKRRKV